MSKTEIYELAEKANSVCEMKNKPFRFWIYGDRYFVCNSIETMDDIDEYDENLFVKKMNSVIKEYAC